MLSERLQILISPAQRRRLETEAERRGTSLASLVRQAIDERFGPVTQEDRLRALEDIRAMRGAPTLTPGELNAIVEEERDEVGDGLAVP